jgi:mRNA interferase RelE/StbE
VAEPPERLYAVHFKRSVVRDLRRLDPPARQRVREAIQERLAHDPRAGKRLAGVRDARSGRSLWSLRAGDYRIVYTFSDAEVWVLVVRVGHRGAVYDDL